MDAFDTMTIIPGSRRPIHIPALRNTSPSSSQTPSPASTDSAHASFPTHRSRRKPAMVLKSPSADEPAEWEGLNVPRKRGTPPYEKPSARQSPPGTAPPSHSLSVPARRAAAQRKIPLLSLYHPLGPLAQSLPALDPGQFGLPSSLNIDDPDDQRDGDSARRSASRPQRPGQKTRERETGDDDAQSNGTPNGVVKAGQETPARNPSPRKRRGGGGKRKRKDAEDGDTTFPAPPVKRTRNPRGVNNAPAAPSPLISEAVAASDLVEDATTAQGEAEEEAQEEAAPAPKRSARARKPRARPAKRRDSSGSASTTTSVSVSIAATATTKPAAQAKPASGPAADPQAAAEPEAPPAAESDEQAPAQTDDASGGDKVESEETGQPLAAPQGPPGEVQPANSVTPVPLPPASPVATEAEVLPPNTAGAPPAPASPTPARLPSPPPVPPPPKEEREEGELSDDGPSN